MDNHYPRRSMPPPPPPVSAPAQHEQDAVHDLYKRLKRRYVELEQKFQAMHFDLERAGEQNRRLVRERDMLLDRIHEMTVSPSSSTSVASTSMATSSRSIPVSYSSRSVPPRIRSSREAALQQFLDEDSEDDIPSLPRRPSIDYDRREFTVNTINGVENGNRPYAVPDRDRYPYPPPAGPVHSTPSHPEYSPDSTTPYRRYQPSLPPTSTSQFQNSNNSSSSTNNPSSNHHHSHHLPTQSHSVHDPYYPPYVHSGPRSRTPPPVSPPPEYYSHKRALDLDEEVASKRIRTGQYQQHQQGTFGSSLPKPASSASSQSGAFVNGSPSPPPQASTTRATGRSRRSQKGRAGSVSASSAAEAPLRRRRSRQSKATRDPSVVPDDEIDIHPVDHRSNLGMDQSVPGSSTMSSARQNSVKERSISPPIPPPSMPMNIVRGGSSPSRPFSPAPPAPPPSGPPPRDRISPVADTRNPSRSNAHAPPPPPLALPRPRSTRPKRLKAHTVQSKSYNIPTVPRTSSGKPQLPLIVGIMTVRNLGKVCLEKHFHTERYIFPVGYEVTRRYSSMHNPEAEAQYTCTILHGSDVDGGSGPRFRIVASDDVEHPITAGTATGAWSVIVKAANKIRNRQHSNSVSGPDYFGLGQNTIKHLLQELENANLLQDYVRQTFVEGGPLGGRHAAVTAAINLDDKPPSEPTASTSHAASHTHTHTSKSSSPMDALIDDQERDGSSVVGTELDRDVEGGEGNDSVSHASPPPIRSPRASGPGPGPAGRDEEDGYPHTSLPSIQTFDQQPLATTTATSQQRGSPSGPTHSLSHSSYDLRSPSDRDRDRERSEKERDRERYGPNSPSGVSSGIRGLINPFIPSEGGRSEYSPSNSSRQGMGHASPRDDYRDRDHA